MVSKKHTTATPAKVKVAPPTMSEASTRSSSRTLLASAFSPSTLHLSLFASAILALDAQRLRIHDTVTSRLRCELTLDKGVAVNHLCWGKIPDSEEHTKKKKRRRTEDDENDGRNLNAVVVAAATSRQGILLINPAEGKITGKLAGAGHSGEVRQFVFSGGQAPGRGWSVGADKRLIEWDVRRKITMRIINWSDAAIQSVVYAPPFVLCGSHKVYAVDPQNPRIKDCPEFTASTSLVQTIIASGDNKRFLSAAESDRFINVFSIKDKKLEGALVAESDVRMVTVHGDVLVAVTTDGAVEIFQNPFAPVSPGDDLKKRKNTTRKSDAVIKIVRPGSKEKVMLLDASLQGNDLVVMWTEGGVNLAFEKIRWSNPETGALALIGQVEIMRGELIGIGGAIAGTVMNGAKDIGKHSVDQSKAMVVGGDDIGDINMEDASEEEGSLAEEEELGTNDEDEDEEPTFGEKAQALQVFEAAKSVTSTVTKPQNPPNAVVKAPATGSLTTVLTQALVTDDRALLESCLHSTDSDAIRATIRRLNSSLAATLLERLAERITRRPGRAGSLNTWVQWTLVAHGGYLVTIPNLMHTVADLHKALSARSVAMPKLLSLQGRLDMLSAQAQLRKSLAAPSMQDTDSKVLYMEGVEERSDDEMESDDEPENVGMQGLQIEDASFIAGDDDRSGDEDASGFDSDSDSDSEDAEEDDDGESNAADFFDAEASEVSDDEGEEDEEDDGEDAPEEDGESVDYDTNDSDLEESDQKVIEKIRKSKKSSL